MFEAKMAGEFREADEVIKALSRKCGFKVFAKIEIRNFERIELRISKPRNYRFPKFVKVIDG